MPAPTQPTEKPPVPEPFIYVLPGMPGILGVLHKKQFIGDNDREIVPEDIWKASPFNVPGRGDTDGGAVNDPGSSQVIG